MRGLCCTSIPRLLNIFFRPKKRTAGRCRTAVYICHQLGRKAPGLSPPYLLPRILGSRSSLLMNFTNSSLALDWNLSLS